MGPPDKKKKQRFLEQLNGSLKTMLIDLAVIAGIFISVLLVIFEIR